MQGLVVLRALEPAFINAPAVTKTEPRPAADRVSATTEPPGIPAPYRQQEQCIGRRLGGMRRRWHPAAGDINEPMLDEANEKLDVLAPNNGYTVGSLLPRRSTIS